MKNIALALVLLSAAPLSPAQGTAFTYQGRLSSNGDAANGTYDLTFSVWTAPGGPSQSGGTLTNSGVTVSNGLFTVRLDFGAGVFTGPDRWLEIGVRSNAAGSFFTLGPRQPITPSPYAILATSVSGTVGSGSIAGTYSSAVTFSNSNNSFAGFFFGDGGALSNVNAAGLSGFGASNFWQLGGNSGNPYTVLGTRDDRPLIMLANNVRALQLDGVQRSAGFFHALIGGNVSGGAQVNSVWNGVLGGTIAGGGMDEQFLINHVPSANTVSDDFGTIGGGLNNTVGNTNADFTDVRAGTIAGGEINSVLANHTTIGGGFNNAIQANAIGSVVAGGRNNLVEANSVATVIAGGEQNDVAAPNGTIGGGVGNTVESGAAGSTIAGGTVNRIRSGSNQGAIGGGAGNAIEANALTATIGGGAGNTIEANSRTSTIGGGQGNRIQNSAAGSTVSGGENNFSGGSFATVPGGQGNAAIGQYSFAAGRSAVAAHDGAFVWADSQNSGFTSTANDQFNIRAANGVRINGSGGTSLMNLDSSGQLTVFGTTQNGVLGISTDANGVLGSSANGNGVQGSSSSAGASGVYGENLSGSGYGVAGRASGSGRAVFGENPNANGLAGYFIGKVAVDGNVCANNVNCASDRNLKAGFESVDAKSILEKVAALPITRWHYTNDADTPHIGAVAQDFHAAFNVGTDDKHIATVDADGVALAAIQGLNQKVEERLAEKDLEIARLKRDVAELQNLLCDLRREVTPQ